MKLKQLWIAELVVLFLGSVCRARFMAPEFEKLDCKEHVVGDPLVWGDASYGGKVPTAIVPELHNISSAATTNHAFVALRQDGRVFAWGDKRYGGDPGSSANMLRGNVTAVAGTNTAFAALRNDSQVVAWGDRLTGGSLGAAASAIAGNAVEIHSNHHAFVALLRDRSLAAWGSRSFGGHISDEASAVLQNVTCVKSSWGAFAALRADGVVVAWGDSQSGGDSSEVSSELEAGEVAELFANDNAFVALRRNGYVVAWGDWEKGGELPETIVGSEINLENVTVKTIYATSQAFAAVTTDGKVVTWGAAHRGGDSSMVQTQLVGVVDIIPSSGAFRARLQDGSVVKWGDTSNTTVYTTGRGTTLHQYSTGRAELALITSRPECRYTDTVTTSTSSSISATSQSSSSSTSKSSHSTPTSSMSTSTSTTSSTSSSPSSTQSTSTSGSGSTNTSSSTSTSSLSSSAASPSTVSTNSSTPTTKPTSSTTSSHSSSTSTSATSHHTTSSSSTTEASDTIVMPEMSAMSFTVSLTVEGEGGDTSYDVAVNFTNDRDTLGQIRVTYANNASVPSSSVTLTATALLPPKLARFLAVAGPNVRLDFQVIISSASAGGVAGRTAALSSGGFQSILDEALIASPASLSATVVTVSEVQVTNHTLATTESSSTSTLTNSSSASMSSTSMSSTTASASTASTASTATTRTDSTESTTSTSSSIAAGLGVTTRAPRTSSLSVGKPGWATSEWGECSALCGEGTQTRETFCARDGNTCPPQARPATTRPCRKPCVVPVVVGAIVVVFLIVACVLIMQILICPRRRRKKQDKLKKTAAEALMHDGSGTDGSMSPKSPKRKKRVSGRSQAGQERDRPSSFVSVAPSSPTSPAARDSISSPGGRGVGLGGDQLRGGATAQQWSWEGDIDDWQMFAAETETTATRTTNMTTTVDSNGPPLTFDEVPTELTVGQDDDEDFSGSDVSSSAYWQSSRPSRATTDGTRSLFESSRATGRSGRRAGEGGAALRAQTVARGAATTHNLTYDDVPDDLAVAPDDEDFSGSDVSSARWQSSRLSRATVEGPRTPAQGAGRRGGRVPVVGREGTAASDLTFDDVPDDLVVAPEDDDQQSESDVSSSYVRTARAAIDAAKTRLESPRAGVARQTRSPRRPASAGASREHDLRFEEVPDDLVVAPEDDDQESVSDVSSAYVQTARAAIEAARPMLEAREEADGGEGVQYWQMYAAYQQAVEPQLTFDEVPDDLDVAPECEDVTSESDVSSAYVRTARAEIEAARPALGMGGGEDAEERREAELGVGGGMDRRTTSRDGRDPDDPELRFDDVPDDLIVAPDVDEELSESDVSSAYVRNARQGIEAARRRLEMLQARAFDDEARRNSAGAWTEYTEDRPLEYDDVPDGLSLPASDAEEITDDGSMVFPDDIDLDYDEVPDQLGVPNDEISDAEGSVRARSIGMSSSATMDNSISGSM